MPNVVGLNFHDIPIGSIQPFGGTVVPTGWLLCDGTAYAKTSFAALFAVIGGNFGTSGANFNVPDLRGRFIRGSDNMGTGAAGRDPDTAGRTAMSTGGATGAVAGSVQADASQKILASINLTVQNFASSTGAIALTGVAAQRPPTQGGSAADTMTLDTSTTTRTSTETRPQNANATYIIKAA